MKQKPEIFSPVLRYVAAGFIGTIGLVFTSAGISDILNGGDGKNSLGISIGVTILMGIAPIVLAFFIFNNGRKKRERSLKNLRVWKEHSLMGFANKEKGGAVSAEEGAVLLGVAFEDAQEILEGLTVKNVMTLKITEEGVILYALNNYGYDKEGAKGILEA